MGGAAAERVGAAGGGHRRDARGRAPLLGRHERLRTTTRQAPRQAILELCHPRCPKCGRKLVETVYRSVRVDRCSGCGGVWLDPGEIEALASEEHQSWLGGLLARLTGTEEGR